MAQNFERHASRQGMEPETQGSRFLFTAVWYTNELEKVALD